MSARSVLSVTRCGDRISVQTDPKRAEAILQVLAGGTLQEAGDFLGITREAVRLYLKQIGIRTRERQRFYGQSKKLWNRWQYVETPYNPKMPRAERRARVERVVRIVRAIHTATGKAPRPTAVAEWLWSKAQSPENAASRLASYLGPVRGMRRLSRRLRVVWHMAGCQKPKQSGRPRRAEIARSGVV